MGKLITSADAARKLRVSLVRVQALCRQRRIPGARLIGRTWMLPADFTVTPGTRGPKLRGARR
ncbi:MAG: helix-turn-helix domain-containing protein [Casimicrobiaceae bacterium]